MNVALTIPRQHGTETVFLPDEEQFVITLGQYVINANDTELTVTPLSYHLQEDDTEEQIQRIRKGNYPGPYGMAPVVKLPNNKIRIQKRTGEWMDIDV